MKSAHLSNSPVSPGPQVTWHAARRAAYHVIRSRDLQVTWGDTFFGTPCTSPVSANSVAEKDLNSGQDWELGLKDRYSKIDENKVSCPF